MPFEPINAVWIGGAPPAWAIDGSRSLRESFPLHSGYDFWIRPPHVRNRETGEWEVPGPVVAEIEEAVGPGWRIRHLDEALGPAGGSLEAYGSDFDADYLTNLANLHQFHGNAIAVKDLAFLMILAGQGGYCLDLTVSARVESSSSKVGDGTKHPPMPPSSYGIRIPRVRGEFLPHRPEDPSHNPSYDLSAGMVRAPRFESFALFGTPPDADGTPSHAQEFWAEALHMYCLYFESAVERSIDDGSVRLVPGTGVRDLRFESIDPAGSVGQWLSSDSPSREEHIGFASIRAITEAWLQKFGRLHELRKESDGTIRLNSPKELAGTTVPVSKIGPFRYALGDHSQKVVRNSWRAITSEETAARYGLPPIDAAHVPGMAASSRDLRVPVGSAAAIRSSFDTTADRERGTSPHTSHARQRRRSSGASLRGPAAHP